VQDINRQKIGRLQSFKCAFAGIWHTLKTQRNAQIHVGIGALILILGLGLDLTLTEWAILVLTCGFVIATEMLNTATESVMDFLTTDYHPHVKIVKDVAAGAVLVSAITAVVVGLLVLGPKVFGLMATVLGLNAVRAP
jgi:diacylglycerol kinase